MARHLEQGLLGQTPAPRASAGVWCKGWVADRLDAQRCPRTRLLRIHIPEAWPQPRDPGRGTGLGTRGGCSFSNPYVLVLRSPWTIFSWLNKALRASMGEGGGMLTALRHTYETGKPLIFLGENVLA